MPGTYKIEAFFNPIAIPAEQGYSVDIGYLGMYVFSPEHVQLRTFKSDDPRRDCKDAHDYLLGAGNVIENASVKMLCELWDAKPEDRYKLLNMGKLTPLS